jgi:predicted ATPase
MLTRLKVSGFKNLVDVDVSFGPFTCVAGANGVGKSNLFDAINFLSKLADSTLVEAALSVRNQERMIELRNLFHGVGDRYASEMSFEAEMIVPLKGKDDLGQQAQATITFVRYCVVIAYRESRLSAEGPLELIKEELVPINFISSNFPFAHTLNWYDSVLKGERTLPFISTQDENGQRIIVRHGDGASNNSLKLLASALPRTVLSVANAAESPTALLARREMQSWRLLQLEPSSLRQANDFSAPTKLGTDGSYLAATLYRLASLNNPFKAYISSDEEATGMVYGQVANRLAELIDHVVNVWVDRDDRRDLLTLYVTDREGTTHPARGLSDGTLRFLALAVLELDPETQGVLCLEEPENGIHPDRIPAILQLLQDIATDTTEPVEVDNPLRQVIINTHSPALVSEVPDASLLVAELKETIQEGQRARSVSFRRSPFKPILYPICS